MLLQELCDSDTGQQPMLLITAAVRSSERIETADFCGTRVLEHGAVRSLDLEDLNLDRSHPPRFGSSRVLPPPARHRHSAQKSEQGTRWVRISQKTAAYLEDYINDHRHDVTDGHGREPLLTSTYGRLVGDTFRASLYRVTRPC